MRTNFFAGGIVLILAGLAALAAVVGFSPSAIFANNVEDCPPVAGNADHLNYSAGDANITCETNYENRPIIEWQVMDMNPTVAPGVNGSGIVWSADMGTSGPSYISKYELSGTPLAMTISDNNISFAGQGTSPNGAFIDGVTDNLTLYGGTFLIGYDNTDSTVLGGGSWYNAGGGSTYKTQVFGEDAAFAYQGTSAACPGGGGDPALVAGAAQVYSKLCLGAPNIAELFAQDNAGNVTQLSTHDGDVWKFDSYNRFTGRHVVVDMEAAMLALEVLTGGSFVTITIDSPEIDWDSEQLRLRNASIQARQDWARMKDDWDSHRDVWNAVNPDSPIGDFPIGQPPLHVVTGKPQWLIDREIELGR